MNSWTLIQTLINGVLNGGTYALLAVGTSLIYGVMRMVNFASSAFFVVGMYLTWFVYSILDVEIYLCIIPMAFLLGCLAYVIYRASLLPIIDKPRTSSIIVTVGLSFVLQNLMLVLFGATPLNIPSALQRSSILIGNFVIPWIRLIAVLAAIGLSILMEIVVNMTQYGRCLRATSENREIAEMLGVNTRLIYSSAWTIGIILTGLEGLLQVPLYNITPSVGGVFRSTAVIACVLGGLGDIRGAFISGIVLGLVEALVSVFLAQELGPAGIFILFLVTLQFKPNGLFGSSERIA